MADMTIVPVNGSDRDWTRHRYILAFGAYGSTVLMLWANSLEDALDVAADWIEEHAPGLFCDESVTEEYDRALQEGLSEEDAISRAEQDCTVLDGGHYLSSSEWFILAEDPSRETVLGMQGRN